jgi:hypothetical protein
MHCGLNRDHTGHNCPSAFLLTDPDRYRHDPGALVGEKTKIREDVDLVFAISLYEIGETPASAPEKQNDKELDESTNACDEGIYEEYDRDRNRVYDAYQEFKPPRLLFVFKQDLTRATGLSVQGGIISGVFWNHSQQIFISGNKAVGTTGE